MSNLKPRSFNSIKLLNDKNKIEKINNVEQPKNKVNDGHLNKDDLVVKGKIIAPQTIITNDDGIFFPKSLYSSEKNNEIGSEINPWYSGHFNNLSTNNLSVINDIVNIGDGLIYHDNKFRIEKPMEFVWQTSISNIIKPIEEYIVNCSTTFIYNKTEINMVINLTKCPLNTWIYIYFINNDNIVSKTKVRLTLFLDNETKMLNDEIHEMSIYITDIGMIVKKN